VQQGFQALADLVKKGFHHEIVQAPTVESLSFPSPSIDRIAKYSMDVTEDLNVHDHRAPVIFGSLGVTSSIASMAYDGW
jgi:hypothetical protein